MRDIRKFYGPEMERLGFGNRTFTLDDAADGMPEVRGTAEKLNCYWRNTPGRCIIAA